jgi:hypothetical protein
LTVAPDFYFLRLAFFFGFDGLMSEIFRIMSSKHDFFGFVFNPNQSNKIEQNFKP